MAPIVTTSLTPDGGPSATTAPTDQLEPFVFQIGGSAIRQPQEEPPYTIIYAPGNRHCKGPEPCKGSIIERDSLQFGSYWPDCPWGAQWVWRHLRCVTQQVLKNVVNMIGTDVEALDGFARLSPSDQATVRSAFDNGRPNGVQALTVPEIKGLLGACGLKKTGTRAILLASLTDFFQTNGLSLDGSLDDLQMRIDSLAVIREMMAAAGVTPAGSSQTATLASTVESKQVALPEATKTDGDATSGSGTDEEEEKPKRQHGDSDYEDEKPAKKPRKTTARAPPKPRGKKVTAIKLILPETDPEPQPKVEPTSAGPLVPIKEESHRTDVKPEVCLQPVVLAVDPEWVASMQPMFRRSARIASAPEPRLYGYPSSTNYSGSFAPAPSPYPVAGGSWMGPSAAPVWQQQNSGTGMLNEFLARGVGLDQQQQPQYTLTKQEPL